MEGNLFCVGSGASLAYSVMDTAYITKLRQIYKENDAKMKISEWDIMDDVIKSVATNNKNRPNLVDIMTLEEAIDMVTWAVRRATHRDGYSGGYINVVHVNASGCHHIRRIDSRSMKV